MVKLCQNSRFGKILLLLLFAILSFALLVTGTRLRNPVGLEPFIGTYYMGDGFFTCRLSINSNQTYSLTWWQDNREAETYTGKFKVENGFIELIPTDVLTDTVGCFSKRLVLVKWEDRSYLFFDDGDERSNYFREQFCQGVKDNTELAREKSGSFFPYINIADKEKISQTKNAEMGPITRIDGSSFCP